jgi:hypothetical protein
MSQYNAIGFHTLVGLVTIYVALHIYVRITHDPREPHMIENKIPFLTPLIGLLNNQYFVKIRYVHHSHSHIPTCIGFYRQFKHKRRRKITEQHHLETVMEISQYTLSVP